MGHDSCSKLTGGKRITFFLSFKLVGNLLPKPNFQVNLKNIEYLRRVLRGTGSVLYRKSLGHVFEPFQTSPPFSFK